MTSFDAALYICRRAVISPCQKYRYELSRYWEPPKGYVCWIMLNPSTADAHVDDPTIRRCIRFTQDWGYGGLFVVNLFAFRATDPKQMLAADDPIGPDCDTAIESAVRSSGRVICAWGTLGHHRLRGRYVLKMLGMMGVTPMCLGQTNGGHPKHPLYIRADTEPVEVADAA